MSGDHPPEPRPTPDPTRSILDGVVDGWHVRVVQPYQAVKEYRCPGCDHEVRERTLHLVVWPEDQPGQRRHWHRPCWERRLAELRRVPRAAGRGRRPRDSPGPSS